MGSKIAYQTIQSQSDNKRLALVVDDSPADAELLINYIESSAHPMSVMALRNVTHLEAILTEYQPRVVFIDYYIDAHTGTELIQSLRKNFPKTPFILLTGRGDEAVAAEALRVGAMDYLRKDDLNATIIDKTLSHIDLYWQTENKLQEQSNALLHQAAIINGTSDFVAHADLKGQLSFLNAAARQALKLPYGIDVSTLHIMDLHPPENHELIRDVILPTLLKGDSWTGELQFKNQEASIIPISLVAFPLNDSNNIICAYAVIMRDLRSEKARERALFHAANHDYLTGLANRAMITTRLEHAIERAKRSTRPFVVLFLDLDHFKGINDTLGHDAGDALLITVAQRLLSIIRKSDKVGRLGGDEFVIVMEGISMIEDVTQLAQRILDSIKTPVSINDQEIFTTASIGIAQFPECGDTSGDLLQKADMAMYRAKAAGRNSYQFYTEELQTIANRYEDIKNKLHGALQRDEFFMAYQPIVNQDAEVTGWEALLRWQRADGTFIPPDEFIPIAEHSGLIIELGRWVIKRCLAQFKLLKKMHSSLTDSTLAINLSALQLYDPLLMELLVSELQQQAIESKHIVLEITESSLVDELQGGPRAIEMLVKQGFLIAMDDFGTGYASFKHLQELPISIVKIDRSFVSNVHLNPGQAVLVKTMLSMAEALGLPTVIEGIETIEERDHFIALGCQRFQGYYFAKPSPLDSDQERLN